MLIIVNIIYYSMYIYMLIHVNILYVNLFHIKYNHGKT